MPAGTSLAATDDAARQMEDLLRAMPEVRTHLAGGRLAFDTAAMPLLYEPRLFDAARALLGDGLVLWGSDFPLRDQRADRAGIEAALGDDAERAAVLGGNAAQLLSL